MRTSIAMTTYNGSKYIEAQLDSLRLQTVKPDEVYICDDQSKDNTAEIVNAYIEQYHLENTWHFQVNEKNLGYADNFHSAMLKCTGDIIFFCDQDDVWRLNKIEVMIGIMARNQKVGVLFSGFLDYDSEQETKVPTVTNPVDTSLYKVKLGKDNIYLHTIGCAMAVRKDRLPEMEKYWYPGLAHDEYLWKIGLSMNMIYQIPAILLDRRCHGKNTSMGKMRTLEKRIRYVEGLQKSFCSMKRCLSDCGMQNTSSYKLIVHNEKGCRMRLQVLKKKYLWYVPLLLVGYADTVITRKTLLMEAYFGIKG